MSATIVLEAGAANAHVSRRGAEWQAWRVDGQNLLWQADPAIWAETAPVLFPVVGWTRDGAVRVAGETYPLGLHGFARHETFEILDRGADRVTLRLYDSPQTHRLYPFRFLFDVGYRLEPTALHVTMHVTNMDDAPLPYSCGIHPGFAWPFAGGDKAAYEIVFDHSEARDVPVITADGLFAAARRTLDFDGRNPPAFAAAFRARGLVLPRCPQPGAHLRGAGRCGDPRRKRQLFPCRAMVAIRGALPRDRILDGPWRPGGVRRRPFRKTVDARAGPGGAGTS